MCKNNDFEIKYYKNIKRKNVDWKRNVLSLATIWSITFETQTARCRHTLNRHWKCHLQWSILFHYMMRKSKLHFNFYSEIPTTPRSKRISANSVSCWKRNSTMYVFYHLGHSSWATQKECKITAVICSRHYGRY